MQLPSSTELPTTQIPPQTIPQAAMLTEFLTQAASNIASTPTDVDMAVDANNSAHVADVNLSSIEPPNPDSMKEPPRTPRKYNVFTAGDRVGIADARRSFDTSVIPSLPFFSVRRFDDWDSALTYYTKVYRAREVLVRSEHHPPALLATVENPNGTTSAVPTVGPGSAIPGPPAPGPVAAATANPAVPTPASGANPPTTLLVPHTAPALTGAAAAGSLPSGSPLGNSTNPIFVSSAFPTPVIPAKHKRQLLSASAEVDEHPLALDKLLPPSRLQRIMEAARLSPTGGRSKSTNYGQQKLSFPKALSTQSSAQTRIKLTSKGKGKDTSGDFDHLNYVRGNPDPIPIDHDDSDSDYTPGPSYPKGPMVLAYPQTRSATGATQVEKGGNAFTSTTTFAPQLAPSISITAPSTLAPAMVAAANAPQSTPFISVTTPSTLAPATVVAATALQTPPNKRGRLNVPQVSPMSIDANEEYRRLVQDASKTPKSAEGSAKRLALIQEALSAEPIPSASRSPLTGPENRQLIIDGLFRTPTPKAAQMTTSTLSTPSVLSFPASRDCTPGPSTKHSAVPASQAASSAKASSPETDYGLESDMDAGFLEEASVFLDQGYTFNKG